MLISLSLGLVLYIPVLFIGCVDARSPKRIKSISLEVGDDQIGSKFMHPV